jgi:hypothetical protein
VWELKLDLGYQGFRKSAPVANPAAFSKKVATIKLWDVAESLKASKLFGSTFGNHFKFRTWREIKTSKRVLFLNFSTDGRYFVTNLGQIKSKSILSNTLSFEFESLENLWVGNQWICYGAMPVFYLPLDFELQCHDVRGDQLAIGFHNGRVLSFDINRKSLNAIFKNSLYLS